MDLNKSMVIGRLTRDPEARTTPQGTSVASFSVATNHMWTDQSGQKQEKVEYHNVVVWRKLADICSQYLRKGSRVYIEGRMQTRDWEGQDGVKRYRTEIVAENMIMLDSKGASTASTSTNEAPLPTAEPVINVEEGETQVPSADTNSNEEDIKIENIPF